MAVIKRTSPGPSIGNVGSGKGAPKSVGMKGNTTGVVSTSGGQHPFLPAPKMSNGTKGGQVSSGRGGDNTYSFLPKKSGGKK